MSNSIRLLNIFVRDLFSRYLYHTPAHITFFITNKCNYRCKTCFYWRQSVGEKKILSLEEIEKITQKFPTFTSIALTGGEPFLRDDLPQIAELFYQNCSVRSFFIPTNGSLPEIINKKTEKILRTCPNALVTVCLSLDGVGEDHDTIRGVKGAYESFLKSLELLKQLKKRFPNLELNCSFTYNQYNQDLLLETFQTVTKKLHLKNFNVSLVRGEARDLKSKQIDIKQYEQLTEKIDQEILKTNVNSKFKSFFSRLIMLRLALVKKLAIQAFKTNKRPLPCLAGQFNLVITEEGDVYPCEMLNKKLGSLRKTNYNIKKILADQQALKIVDWIKDDHCCCTHEFNLPDNLLYSAAGMKYFISQIFNS